MNEWIKFDGPFYEFQTAALNKPGTLVEVREREGPVQYLIGHVTPLGISSDEDWDARSVFSSDWVIRYRAVWQADKQDEGGQP